MCDKCPAERERITAKYGVVVVAMLYSQAEHALTYNIHLGAAQVAVTLPMTADMTDEVECAGFIGAHLYDLLAATSRAFMEREAESHAASAVADLEAWLRDNPGS